MPIWIQRVFLVLLLVPLASIQGRFTIMTIELAADHTRFQRPASQLDPDTLALGQPLEVLKDAGVKEGDILVEEGGHPIHSLIDATRIYFGHSPGDRISMKLKRGSGAPFEISFIVPTREKQSFSDFVVSIALNIITPWSCILLSFFVAFRKTGDPVAYALLAFLLSVSQLLKAEGAPRLGWETFFTGPIIFFDALAIRSLMASWMWFALVFPDPKSKHKLLPWAGWLLGIPYTVVAILSSLYTTILLHHPESSHWLEPLTAIPGWLIVTWGSALVGLGFMNLFYKLGRENQPDRHRRLRWVIAGLSAGVWPTLSLLGIAAIWKIDINAIWQIVLIPLVLSPFLVPVTLAYAVLVDRTFDIGVFVRQGLLASKSVQAIRIILIAGLVWAGIRLDFQNGASLVVRLIETIALAAAIGLVRRGSEWLRAWVDRRFFQEAVNTEHLLAQLSTEVRRMRDPDTLLRTVADRIASALHVSHVVALIPNISGYAPAYAMGTAGYGVAFDLPFTDPAVKRMRQERQPISSADGLLLPISTADELHGILRLGPKRSEEPYSNRDLLLLESVASQTALALENSRLTATVASEAAHRERITSELEIARKVQERLFPKHAPAVPGIDLAGRCKPAETVGGDYYDFLVTPSGAIGLAIGDVAGKGVPAALLMAGLQASLRGLTLAGISDLADLMAKLNVLIYDATPANRFATFFYGLYDPASRRLRYSSAGHNPALLLRKGSTEPVWLKTRGVALGLARVSAYEQGEIQLNPGDRLVLYTDGVTEARTVEGAEFGEDRLASVLQSCSDRSAAETLGHIVDQVMDFADGARQHDDITLIVARLE